MSKDDNVVGKSKCLLCPSPPHPMVKTPSCTERQESRVLFSSLYELMSVVLENRMILARPGHGMLRRTGQESSTKDLMIVSLLGFTFLWVSLFPIAGMEI